MKRRIVTALTALAAFAALILAIPALAIPVLIGPALTVQAKSFSDVAANAWYLKDVDYISNAGVMTGKTENKFSPSDKMSRAEMVTTLARIAAEELPEYAPVFPDVPEDQWYAPYVIWAYQNGVTTGYDNGKFGPIDRVKREQFVTMLHRFNKTYGGCKQNAARNNLYKGFLDANQVDSFAKDAVNWAIELGILTGRGDRTLDPRGPLTRAEAAAILSRYMRLRAGAPAPEIARIGWITIGPLTMYVDPATGKQYRGGIYNINGGRYLFDSEGFNVTGWYDSKGQMLYFSRSQRAAYVNRTANIDGMNITFNADGIALNYIRPGAGKTFPTIQSAINALIGRYPALRSSSVNPIIAYIGLDAGTYNESINLNPGGNSAISGIEFFGTGKVTWTTTAPYPDGPLFANGTNTYKNITFAAKGVSPTPAYAYHYEGIGHSTPAHSTEVLFEDCDFTSAAATSIGIGASLTNTHIRFRRCTFNNGIFIHNNPTPGGGANYIVFESCRGSHVSIDDAAYMQNPGRSSQLDLRFTACSFTAFNFRTVQNHRYYYATTPPSWSGITLTRN